MGIKLWVLSSPRPPSCLPSPAQASFSSSWSPGWWRSDSPLWGGQPMDIPSGQAGVLPWPLASDADPIGKSPRTPMGGPSGSWLGSCQQSPPSPLGGSSSLSTSVLGWVGAALPEHKAACAPVVAAHPQSPVPCAWVGNIPAWILRDPLTPI